MILVLPPLEVTVRGAAPGTLNLSLLRANLFVSLSYGLRSGFDHVALAHDFLLSWR